MASLNNLAWILADLRKKPDEALPLATKAEQLAPSSPEVLDTLGWIQYRRAPTPRRGSHWRGPWSGRPTLALSNPTWE